MDHPVILAAYTRAEAIAHGFLVDVSDEAALAGFTMPVAMTCAAWSAGVEWTPMAQLREAKAGQPARLVHLVEQLMGVVTRSQVCRRTLEDETGPVSLDFDIEPGGRHGDGRPIVLSLRVVFVLADGDQAAITIMLPDEF